jgi:ribonuclease T1
VQTGRFRRTFWRVFLACVLALPAAGAQPKQHSAPPLPEVGVAELPREARDVLALVRHGGPFPYERDGVAFGNRERHLPARASGDYRVYTVRTPGAKTRGARRIVCGGPPRTPDACFYTDDHYRSFRRIRE